MTALYPLLAAATEPAALTPDSTIPLGMMWGILTTAVIGTAAVIGVWYRLGTIADTVRTINANGWTLQDQTLWSTQLAKNNRTLDVPEPRKLTPAADAGGK